jgi:hypothetical protein
MFFTCLYLNIFPFLWLILTIFMSYVIVQLAEEYLESAIYE